MRRHATEGPSAGRGRGCTGSQVRELHAGLQALPEGERAVLELVAVDGLSVAEAAAALNIRQVTARVRLHRARQNLGSAAPSSLVQREVMS
jgi:DNA-directed RNA polymerase specialized sigma24 family protein